MFTKKILAGAVLLAVSSASFAETNSTDFDIRMTLNPAEQNFTVSLTDLSGQAQWDGYDYSSNLIDGKVVGELGDNSAGLLKIASGGDLNYIVDIRSSSTVAVEEGVLASRFGWTTTGFTSATDAAAVTVDEYISAHKNKDSAASGSVAAGGASFHKVGGAEGDNSWLSLMSHDKQYIRRVSSDDYLKYITEVKTGKSVVTFNVHGTFI